MKICKRCFKKFKEEKTVDVSPATELADYLDSRFHGNYKGTHGNDRRAGISVLKTLMVFTSDAA